MILTLNAGSSGMKCAVFDGSLVAVARGEIAALDSAPHLLLHDPAGAPIIERRWPDRTPQAEVVNDLLDAAGMRFGAGGTLAVGHRVVHGGPDHVRPERVTPRLLAKLDALTELDPLHMPGCLAPIHAIAAASADRPQIVCFDTAFHHTLPPVARVFAIPRRFTEAGVRRYGFHGLSYEYVAGLLAPPPARAIVAHLGSGASLCALRDGRSIATTMGFSALDGLVMGTRCGALDPGVILHLARLGMGFSEIEDVLYRRSGLLGVSGISGDVRDLLTSDDPRAAPAVELFVYRIVTELCGLIGALGGLDLLVFTGGIGTHAPAIRRMVCDALGWLGLRLDEAANTTGAACISTPDSAMEVRVIATDEEVMIARHTQSVLHPPTLVAINDGSGASR